MQHLGCIPVIDSWKHDVLLDDTALTHPLLVYSVRLHIVLQIAIDALLPRAAGSSLRPSLCARHAHISGICSDLG